MTKNDTNKINSIPVPPRANWTRTIFEPKTSSNISLPSLNSGTFAIINYEE